MSASAGRVLIIPRGEYSSETTYQMLDLVRYGSGTFICKKTSLGNTPDYEQDTEYWQLLVLSGDVAGVKGNAEEEYRRGLVNIDYDDLGIDSELSSVSDLPLKNKAIKAALDEKQDDIGIDEEPTAYSEKLVYSGGVDKAIKNISTPFVSYDSMATTDHTNAGITTGGRNLLNNTLTTGTVDGITFTKNIDSSVTMSGTATNSGYETVGSISLGEGTFTVTQAEDEGDKVENLLGDLYVFDGSDNVLAYTSESHNSFTLQSAATVTVKIKYTDTTVYDDKRIYPMVRIGYEINDNYESFYTLMPTFNSGERNSTLFSRISALFNNVRKLWNTVGSTALDTTNFGATVTAQLKNLTDGNTYSTSETWTGRYWKDGKKIYRRTIEGTTPSSYTDSGTLVDVSGWDIDDCIFIEGFILLYSANSYYKHILPTVIVQNDGTVSAWVSVWYRKTAKNFAIGVKGYTNQSITVTVYYTKTST